MNLTGTRYHLTALDIETSGLSPLTDRVVSVAVASGDGFTVWEDSNERRLLDDVATWLCSRAGTNETLVTWNGSGFDWPFLATRAATVESSLTGLLTLTLCADRAPTYRPLDGHDGGYRVTIPGWDHLDAMLPYRAIAERDGGRWALKAVARDHGINVVEVDRQRIGELSKSELAAYNVSDVDATARLAARLGSDAVAYFD